MCNKPSLSVVDTVMVVTACGVGCCITAVTQTSLCTNSAKANERHTNITVYMLSKYIKIRHTNRQFTMSLYNKWRNKISSTIKKHIHEMYHKNKTYRLNKIKNAHSKGENHLLRNPLQQNSSKPVPPHLTRRSSDALCHSPLMAKQVVVH